MSRFDDPYKRRQELNEKLNRPRPCGVVKTDHEIIFVCPRCMAPIPPAKSRCEVCKQKVTKRGVTID